MNQQDRVRQYQHADWESLPIPSEPDFAARLSTWRKSQRPVRNHYGRRAEGMTHAALAKALGVALSGLHSWEAGSPVSEAYARRFEALREGGPEALRDLMVEKTRKKFGRVGLG